MQLLLNLEWKGGGMHTFVRIADGPNSFCSKTFLVFLALGYKYHENGLKVEKRLNHCSNFSKSAKFCLK